MAENKLHVCFLHKHPIRNSVPGTFSTHKINKLLELQKRVILRDYLYYCSGNIVISFATVDIS